MTRAHGLEKVDQPDKGLNNLQSMNTEDFKAFKRTGRSFLCSGVRAEVLRNDVRKAVRPYLLSSTINTIHWVDFMTAVMTLAAMIGN